MSEISEQVRVEVNSSVPRPPVKWQITSVTDETKSVTVVFPLSPETVGNNLKEAEEAKV